MCYCVVSKGEKTQAWLDDRGADEMKIWRMVLLIPGMIFTVLCILHELSLVSSELNKLNLFWTCFKWCSVGLVSTFVYALLAVKYRWEAKGVLRANLLMKLVALPVHAVGLFLLCGIISDFFERMDYPIVSFLYLWIGSFFVFFSYGIAVTIQSGIIGIAGAIVAKCEGKLSKKAAIWYGICGCMPIVDIVIAVLMCKKVKQ